MKKRILSIILVLALCLTLMPMTVFATGTEEVGGKTLPYSFDFETDMKAEGWTNIDADCDGQDWITATNIYGAEGWGVEGSRCAISQSYDNNLGAFNADNWLFSPAITIPEGGATVSWYEQSQDVSYPDFYEVYVSETNTSTDTSKMTEIFSGTAANPWNQRSVELEAAEYAGKTVYIAFRHLCYDCYILEIDDFAAGAVAPAHTHTVTFDANGGSVTPTSAETGTDGKLATLPTPTRSGSYSFDGWYTMKEGGTKVDTNTVFTAAATIYAHWSRSFSFAHLPKTGVATITVHEGDYYTGLAAKDAFIRYWDENIKTDGDFLLIDYFDTYDNDYHSWMITIENGVAEAVDGGFTDTWLDILNDLTSWDFFASYDWWVNGTYSAIHTVTVQNDGNGTASADTSSAAKGDTVTLTATPAAGYHFKEWQSSDVTISGNTFTMPEKNVTVKAIFEQDTPAPVKITEIVITDADITPVLGEKAGDHLAYTLPADCHYSATMNGWWDILGSRIMAADDVFEDGGLYCASWNFVADEGYAFAANATITINGSTENVDTEHSYLDTTGDEPLFIISAKGVLVEAQPPAPAYTIIAGMDGEWTKGSMAGLSFTSDAPFAKFDSIKVDGSTIAAANYTAEEGSTKITLASAYLETLSIGSHSIVVVSTNGTASTNFTVKAAAQPPVPAKYTVSFNMNGHGTQVADQTVEDGNKATKPADPTAEGWTFDGWYADATFSVKFDFDSAINADTTVYAKWTEVKKDGSEVDYTYNPFTDIPGNSWYTDAALWCNDKGYISGTSATTFSPDGKLTRAQFVQILAKVSGEDFSGIEYIAKFTDVPDGKWYTKAVTWCVANGVTGGTSTTTFTPDGQVTREQLATFFLAYAKSRGYDVTASANLSKYTDAGTISNWAKTAVQWAIGEGLISGTTATTISPKTVATRAQAAVIFKNFVEGYVAKQGK